DLVARHVKASLRLRQHGTDRAESRVFLVDPPTTLEFHVLPADRDPALDILGVAGMKLLALLARDRQALRHGLGIELNRLLAAHVAAGEHTLGTEIARRRVPNLVDDIARPGDAAVDVSVALPEPLGLPADLAGSLGHRIGSCRDERCGQIGLQLRENRQWDGANACVRGQRARVAVIVIRDSDLIGAVLDRRYPGAVSDQPFDAAKLA